MNFPLLGVFIYSYPLIPFMITILFLKFLMLLCFDIKIKKERNVLFFFNIVSLLTNLLKKIKDQSCKVLHHFLPEGKNNAFSAGPSFLQQK